jgi:hypothetical protein
MLKPAKNFALKNMVIRHGGSPFNFLKIFTILNYRIKKKRRHVSEELTLFPYFVGRKSCVINIQ